jgi:leader peptidase (prepilin peptidase)/N-methyltransferase
MEFYADALTGLPIAGRAALGALLGLVIGSFIAAIVVRWPEEHSIIRGRSHCDSCNRLLRWFELIPLASFVVLRGRCRSCGARVDRAHISAEVLAALATASAFVAHNGIEALAGAVLGWFLLALALLDIRHYWLPDRLTLPLLLLGLGAAWLVPSLSLQDGAIGAIAGFAFLTLLNAAYRALRGQNGLGGGDAKLFAAIGAWLGWALLPMVLLVGSLTGLLVVAVMRLAGRRLKATDRVPLGAMLAFGGWMLWLSQDAFALGTARAAFP